MAGTASQHQAGYPRVQTTTFELRPGPASETLHFSATAGANAALGTLVAIPVFTDGVSLQSRVPSLVIIQVPASAANSVWVTWDGVTAAGAAPPAFEIQAGQSLIIENAQILLSSATNSIIQVAATAPTTFGVHFGDTA